MSLHVDAPRSRAALGGLVILLGLNLTWAPWGSSIAGGLGLAWVLPALKERPTRGWPILFAWIWAALLGLGITWSGDPDRAWAMALRVASGSTVALAFAFTASEGSLRSSLQPYLPDDLLELLDRALLQGRLLASTLHRRQEANRLRQGGWPGCALALASGVEQAFLRSLRLEGARSLRTAPDPTSHGPVLALEKLGIRSEEGFLLQGIDLNLSPGEWLAVLGPSGSGKSTLLNVIAGLKAPSEGRLIRHGQRAEGRVDGFTGLVFQDPEDQLLGSTPLEDAAWGLTRRGKPLMEAQATAADLLARLGLQDRRSYPIHRLSHGERKRAALASVLVLEPRLLLLDEPTAGLDPRSAWALTQVIEREADRTALLWTTHDWANLPPRIQRVLILEAGRLGFLGPREEALRPDRLRRHGLIP